MMWSWNQSETDQPMASFMSRDSSQGTHCPLERVPMKVGAGPGPLSLSPSQHLGDWTSKLWAQVPKISTKLRQPTVTCSSPLCTYYGNCWSSSGCCRLVVPPWACSQAQIPGMQSLLPSAREFCRKPIMWWPHNPPFFPVTVLQYTLYWVLLLLLSHLHPPRTPGCLRFLTWPLSEHSTGLHYLSGIDSQIRAGSLPGSCAGLPVTTLLPAIEDLTDKVKILSSWVVGMARMLSKIHQHFPFVPKSVTQTVYVPLKVASTG